MKTFILFIVGVAFAITVLTLAQTAGILIPIITILFPILFIAMCIVFIFLPDVWNYFLYKEYLED